MRPKIVARQAEAQIQEIAAYISQEYLDAAERDLRSAFDTFFEWPDTVTPVQAHEALPKHIRRMHVTGFHGYVLFVSFKETEIVLLSAFSPGLSDRSKLSMTRASLDDQD